MNTLRLLPNKGLGRYILGSDIQEYQERYGVVLHRTEDSQTGWSCYKDANSKVYLYTEDHNVVAITVYDSCTYKGHELIGMPIGDFLQLLDIEPDEIGEPIEYQDGDVQTPYEFYELELEIWTSKGVVCSISV